MRRITYEQEEAPGPELEMPGIEVEDQAILSTSPANFKTFISILRENMRNSN